MGKSLFAGEAMYWLEEMSFFLLIIFGLAVFFSRGRTRRIKELVQKVDSLEKAIRQLTETVASGQVRTGDAGRTDTEAAYEEWEAPAPEAEPYSVSLGDRYAEGASASRDTSVPLAASVMEPAVEKTVSPEPELVVPEHAPADFHFAVAEEQPVSAPESAPEPVYAKDFPMPEKPVAAEKSETPAVSTEAFSTESSLFAFSATDASNEPGESGGEAEGRETPSFGLDHEPSPMRESVASGYIHTIINFIRGGNIWVAGGVIMLLLGFAFLAQLGVFPIEFRIAMAALSGMVMVAGGIYLRLKRPMYALILQGGGIGVLYLSAFASAKLTDILPPAAALVIMTALIVPAVALAILQNAQVLALFGFLGGFAAPILLSDGSGNYVALFSCYTLLNLGILAISRYRLWRWLNLAGALSSFVVMGYWGVTSYNVSMFSKVEPFLIAFILIYICITLVSVRKKEFSYSEPLDMILACSVPFVAAIFQWRLATDIPHGLSISAVAFGTFFILLASLVWKLWGENYRRLAEFYLANGVVLANLAIPLELSGNVTAAVWAIEGAVLFFFSCRIRSARIKVVALLLQVVGMGAMIWDIADNDFYTHTLLSTSLVSLAAIVSACFHKLDVNDPRREKPESVNAWLGDLPLERVLVLAGLFWWYAGMGFEAYKFAETPWAMFLAGVAVSSALAYVAERYTGLGEFRLAMVHVPLATAGIYLASHIGMDVLFRPLKIDFFLRYNFLAGWGAVAWGAFAATQGALLFLRREKGKPLFHAWWSGVVALEVLLMLTSSGRGMALVYRLAPSWGSLAGILPALLYTVALVWILRKFLREEGGAFTPSHARILGGTVPAVLFVLLISWLVLSFFDLGDPSPLPMYIPLLNPLEIQQALCIAIFTLWQRTVLDVKEIRLSLPVPKLLLLIDGLAFAWLHSMLFRAIAFMTGTPMYRAWDHESFQALLTALWGVWGMAHLIIGNRKRVRLVWVIGASLMLADTAKLFLVDLADKGTLFRVISFFVMGGIFLLIGWLAPLPPSAKPGANPSAGPGVKPAAERKDEEPDIPDEPDEKDDQSNKGIFGF